MVAVDGCWLVSNDAMGRGHVYDVYSMNMCILSRVVNYVRGCWLCVEVCVWARGMTCVFTVSITIMKCLVWCRSVYDQIGVGFTLRRVVGIKKRCDSLLTPKVMNALHRIASHRTQSVMTDGASVVIEMTHATGASKFEGCQ